jgi:hypothetical protein
MNVRLPILVRRPQKEVKNHKNHENKKTTFLQDKRKNPNPNGPIKYPVLPLRNTTKKRIQQKSKTCQHKKDYCQSADFAKTVGFLGCKPRAKHNFSN